MTLTLLSIVEAKLALDNVRSLVCKYAHEYIAEPTLDNQRDLEAILQEEARVHAAMVRAVEAHDE